eukprot:symbB.v1.2.040706.t1/scaffold7456.1/size11148/2
MDQHLPSLEGVACFASFDVMVNGTQVVKEGLFLTSPASDACGDQLPLVSVPLNHDRSGHAELKAMQWLLQNLREASVPAGKSLCEVTGHMSLHVTHHPCLSCLGAFAQLQGILPQLQLYVWQRREFGGKASQIYMFSFWGVTGQPFSLVHHSSCSPSVISAVWGSGDCRGPVLLAGHGFSCLDAFGALVGRQLCL